MKDQIVDKIREFKKKTSLKLVAFFASIVLVGGFFLLLKSNLISFDFTSADVVIGEKEEQKKITAQELAHGVAAVKRFYESQNLADKGLRIDFSTEEGKLRLKVKEREVLNKLVENGMIKILAERKGIKVSSQELESEFKRKAEAVGSKGALEKDINRLYGWSAMEFKNDILAHQLQLAKLFEIYLEELKDKDSFKKIAEVREQLLEDPDQFDHLAKTFSQGESAVNGGRLSWFKKDQLINEVAREAFAMNKEAISDVIVSPLGYHIIRVDDIRQDGEVDQEEDDFEKVGQAKRLAQSPEKEELERQKDGKDPKEEGEKKGEKEVKLSQIFIAEGNFIQWLVAQKKQIPVKVNNDQYVWERENVRIEFSDPLMQEKERDIRIKSEGDPSVQLVEVMEE